MPDIPEGSVVITPGEVYAEVKMLTTEVTKLVARMDSDNLSNRVRSLEQFRWVLVGVCLAGGGLAGTVAQSLPIGS